MAILGSYRSYSFDLQNNSSISSSIPSHTSSPLPEPIGKGRSSSTSSSITSDSGLGLGFYPRAPGSEREDSQVSSKVLHIQSIIVTEDKNWYTSNL